MLTFLVTLTKLRKDRVILAHGLRALFIIVGKAWGGGLGGRGGLSPGFCGGEHRAVGAADRVSISLGFSLHIRSGGMVPAVPSLLTP